MGFDFGSFLCHFLNESNLKGLKICGNVDDVLYWKVKFRFSRQTSAFDSRSWTVAERLEIIAL